MDHGGERARRGTGVRTEYWGRWRPLRGCVSCASGPRAAVRRPSLRVTFGHLRTRDAVCCGSAALARPRRAGRRPAEHIATCAAGRWRFAQLQACSYTPSSRRRGGSAAGAAGLLCTGRSRCANGFLRRLRVGGVSAPREHAPRTRQLLRQIDALRARRRSASSTGAILCDRCCPRHGSGGAARWRDPIRVR